MVENVDVVKRHQEIERETKIGEVRLKKPPHDSIKFGIYVHGLVFFLENGHI